MLPRFQGKCKYSRGLYTKESAERSRASKESAARSRASKESATAPELPRKVRFAPELPRKVQNAHKLPSKVQAAHKLPSKVQTAHKLPRKVQIRPRSRVKNAMDHEGLSGLERDPFLLAPSPGKDLKDGFIRVLPSGGGSPAPLFFTKESANAPEIFYHQGKCKCSSQGAGMKCSRGLSK